MLYATILTLNRALHEPRLPPSDLLPPFLFGRGSHRRTVQRDATAEQPMSLRIVHSFATKDIIFNRWTEKAGAQPRVQQTLLQDELRSLRPVQRDALVACLECDRDAKVRTLANRSLREK